MKTKNPKLMPMKRDLMRLSVFFLATLLFLTSISTMEVAATVVFEDDFQDGNMNGWTCPSGNYTCYEYAPSEYAIYSGSSGDQGHLVWTPTPVLDEGTWSFDYFHSYNPINSWVYFFFFLNGTTGVISAYDSQGYWLEIYRGDSGLPSLRLIKRNHDVDTLLKFWVFPEFFDGTWTHFDITRDGATGEMNVWMNGTWIMDATDTEFNHSEKFVWMNFKGGVIGDRIFQDIMLDNVVADDEILLYHDDGTTTTTEPTTPTEPTTTDPGDGEPFVLDPMLLAIGGGAVALIIIIVIVLKRK